MTKAKPPQPSYPGHCQRCGVAVEFTNRYNRLCENCKALSELAEATRRTLYTRARGRAESELKANHTDEWDQILTKQRRIVLDEHNERIRMLTAPPPDPILPTDYEPEFTGEPTAEHPVVDPLQPIVDLLDPPMD